jgi:hypothetical protein
MSDWDARNCTVEEIRYLLSCGYRASEASKIEAGIDKLWHMTDWWVKAVNQSLNFVIDELIAA